MIERVVTIRNEAGIHCRPSSVIVKTAVGYPGTIRIQSKAGVADCRSIMGLLCLAMEKGTQITISVSGQDEERMSQELVELFETEFDFPPQ